MNKRVTITTSLLWALLIAIGSTFSVAASAQSLTPQQIQQFKSLTPQEQARLAQSLGITLPTPGSVTSQTLQEEPEPTIAHGEEAQQLQQQAERETPSELIDGLPLFGYDFLAGFPKSFTPIADLPIPSDYIVGPGDELTIQLYGKENQSYQLVVGRDGFINIPQLGPVSVAGKQFDQVKTELELRVKKQIIGADLAVGMGRLRLMQVYVLGDAKHPGAYNLSSLATATQALMAAGGIANTGSLRRVDVLRARQKIAQLDLYDLFLKGDRSNDIRLQSGDAVFVHPVGERVRVDGEVVRPAIYEALPGQTVKGAIEWAGGLKSKAYAERVRLDRLEDTGIHTYSLDLNQAADRSFVVRGGDEVMVGGKSTAVTSAVELLGAVVRPGKIGLRTGMRVSDAIGDPRASLSISYDRNIGLLVREADTGDITVYYIPLQQVIENPQDKMNLVLQARDQLIVLPDVARLDETANGEKEKQEAIDRLKLDKSLAEEKETTELDPEKNLLLETLAEQRRQLIAGVINRLAAQVSAGDLQQIVEIRGPVKYPGIYPLMAGGTLGQLFQLAGGGKEEALLDQAELSRILRERQRNEIVSLRLDLTSPDALLQALQPRDRVTVFPDPDWQNDITVTIRGEVKFPGTYTLERGRSLADIVSRAGGFTAFAYPEGAILSRRELKEREQQQLTRLRETLKEEVATLSLQRSSSLSPGLSVSPTEAIKVVDELSSTRALGRLVINLPAALQESSAHNISVEDGDELYIPSRTNTVTVVGEVQYASSHVFEKGLSFKDYIERAGGVRKRADAKRIYVIRASGQVAMPRNSWFGVQLQQGDTIVVPIDTDYTDNLTLFSTATQILYQLGVAYSAIKN